MRKLLKLSTVSQTDGFFADARKRATSGVSGRVAATWLGVLLLAGTPGCGFLKAPQHVVSAVVPSSGSRQPDPVDLQLQVQRFADDYNARVTEALDEYARRVGTQEARIETLRLQVLSASAVVSIASGPNPNASLLDLVAVVSLARMTIEGYWIKTPNGPAFQPWLETSRVLETNVWALAGTVLKPQQINELRDAIKEWYERTPDVRSGFFARPSGIAALLKPASAKGPDLNSVFSLIGLDPTSGLDPAVREVTRTRLFAERAMYTLQRMPFLLRGHTELLVRQTVNLPEVTLALTNVARLSESADRISRATENLSQTTAQLPERISSERKAILTALEEQGSKLQALAGEVNRSLLAGEKMSTSLNTTLTTFDALMKRFGVGEPRTNAKSGPVSANSRPFDVLDYGQAATQVAAMALDLNTLITSVTQSMPQAKQLGQQATADAERVVHRAFWLGLVLVFALLVGSVLAALAYRNLANRLGRSAAGPPPPNS